MNIGVIGLGKMGRIIAKKLSINGINTIGYDSDSKQREITENNQIKVTKNLDSMLNNMHSPKIIWLMLPHGKPTETTIKELSKKLFKDDIVIDGGNSFFKDSIRRGKLLKSKEIDFFDVGTSGGIAGEKHGFSLMVGGDSNLFIKIEKIFKILSASKTSYGRVGPIGSGHFVKMIHNAIEYGMMESLTEGFSLLTNQNNIDSWKFDLHQISKIWGNGSVIRSWLLDLISNITEKREYENLNSIVNDSGEGRWAIQEAIEQGTPIPSITSATFARFYSQNKNITSSKLLVGLRKAFGGHT